MQTLYNIDAGKAVTQHGVIRVSGNDARDFLNGQLSNDINAVTVDRGQLTSLSNAKGRLLAVLYAVADGADVLLITPRTLCTDLVTYLQRYVLRANVSISEIDCEVVGTWGGEASGTAFHVHRDDIGIHIRLGGSVSRMLSVVGASDAAPEAQMNWRRVEIASGMGWVYPETSGRFVAQMLNLDLTDGISFTKGCYTGQEIIARMKHRGRVRRRMLRFTANTGEVPAPGNVIYAGDDKAGEIVDAVGDATGIELLAVVQLARLPGPFTLGPGAGDLELARLPYAIPEAG